MSAWDDRAGELAARVSLLVLVAVSNHLLVVPFEYHTSAERSRMSVLAPLSASARSWAGAAHKATATRIRSEFE